MDRTLNKLLTAAAIAVGTVCLVYPVLAADYMTAGGDPERTGWLKDEKTISKANVGQIKLLWKKSLPSTPRQMHNLFSPLVVQSLRTPSGTKEVAIVAGVSDDLWGLDAKTGDVLWSKHFPAVGLTGQGPQGGTLCPGGQTAV